MPPPVGPQKKWAGCDSFWSWLLFKGCGFCPHSYQFWTLLSRQGTFMGKMKSSRHKQDNKTTTKLLNPPRPQKQGPQHQKFKLWLVSPAGN